MKQEARWHGTWEEGTRGGAQNSTGRRAWITFRASLAMSSLEKLISGFFTRVFSSRSSSSEETSLSLMWLASSCSFLFSSSSSASGSSWGSGAGD